MGSNNFQFLVIFKHDITTENFRVGTLFSPRCDNINMKSACNSLLQFMWSNGWNLFLYNSYVVYLVRIFKIIPLCIYRSKSNVFLCGTIGCNGAAAHVWCVNGFPSATSAFCGFLNKLRSVENEIKPTVENFSVCSKI